MTFWRRQNNEDSKGAVVAKGWVVGMGRTDRAQLIFRAMKIYDSIMMTGCYYTFVQIHRLYNAKTAP